MVITVWRQSLFKVHINGKGKICVLAKVMLTQVITVNQQHCTVLEVAAVWCNLIQGEQTCCLDGHTILECD